MCTQVKFVVDGRRRGRTGWLMTAAEISLALTAATVVTLATGALRNHAGSSATAGATAGGGGATAGGGVADGFSMGLAASGLEGMGVTGFGAWEAGGDGNATGFFGWCMAAVEQQVGVVLQAVRGAGAGVSTLYDPIRAVSRLAADLLGSKVGGGEQLGGGAGDVQLLEGLADVTIHVLDAASMGRDGAGSRAGYMVSADEAGTAAGAAAGQSATITGTVAHAVTQLGAHVLGGMAGTVLGAGPATAAATTTAFGTESGLVSEPGLSFDSYEPFASFKPGDVELSGITGLPGWLVNHPLVTASLLAWMKVLRVAYQGWKWASNAEVWLVAAAAEVSPLGWILQVRFCVPLVSFQ